MELGHAAQARRLWEKALEWFPGLEFARENLADLQAPVDQRQGSWAVGFQGWLSLLAYEEFDRIVKSRQGGADPYAILQQRVLRLCPQLPRLVPLLLERGDPRACTFAWWIAATSDEREMLDALRAFALGQRGPDKMRLDALAVLRRKNVLPDRRLKMWLQGEWRDEMLYSWDIYSESVEHGWPREVGLLSSRATDALQEGEPAIAEYLLEKALEIQPNAPELLNNLTAVYSYQGRYEEVEALAERIHRDHPDYWFGRTNLAVMLAHRGEIERARELVDPLLDQQRLHVSEFSALCYTQAFLARAERKWNVALAWADQLERVLPNDPKVKMIRSWKRS
jgi:tetratricopeptide (TPR) repeat protein